MIKKNLEEREQRKEEEKIESVSEKMENLNIDVNRRKTRRRKQIMLERESLDGNPR